MDDKSANSVAAPDDGEVGFRAESEQFISIASAS